MLYDFSTSWNVTKCIGNDVFISNTKLNVLLIYVNKPKTIIKMK